MATKVEIVNAALMLIGGNGDLTNLNQNRREAQVANRLYDTTYQTLLTEYHWRFSVARKKLNKVQTATVYGFKNVYQMPPDCLRLLAVEPYGLDYDVENDKLMTDVSSDVYVKFIRDMPEGEFPPYFTRTLELRLASLFATAIADDSTKAQLFDSQYMQQRQLAMALDGSQRPAIQLDSGMLLRGRITGRAY